LVKKFYKSPTYLSILLWKFGGAPKFIRKFDKSLKCQFFLWWKCGGKFEKYWAHHFNLFN